MDYVQFADRNSFAFGFQEMSLETLSINNLYTEWYLIERQTENNRTNKLIKNITYQPPFQNISILWR